MNIGPNPIAADAARRALVENDRLDANRNDVSRERAALDAEELRDLERSLYAASSATVATTPVVPEVPATQPSRRSLIARLFRRR